MANKIPPTTFNYSINYQIAGSPVRQAQPKPKVLTIAAIPDDHTVVVDAIGESGFEFNTSGNFIFPALSGALRKEIVLGGTRGEHVPAFQRPDIVFNRICEPDSNRKGLELARKIIDENKLPALNHPDKVLATARDALYRRFANMNGVVVPKTLRVTPKYCREVQALLEQEVVRLPCIFRPAGGHNSSGGRPAGQAERCERTGMLCL